MAHQITAEDLFLAISNGAGDAGQLLSTDSAHTITWVDSFTEASGDARYVQQSGGTMTGALFLPAAAPTQAAQASTKSYVDAQHALSVPVSGGAMTGPLILNADPTAVLGAVTKQYADTKLSLAGGSLTGTLLLDRAPTAAYQAATKAYVDGKGTAVWTTGAAYPVGQEVLFDGIVFTVEVPIAAAPAVPDFTTISPTGYGQSDYWTGTISSTNWGAANWIEICTMPGMGSYRVKIDINSTTRSSSYILEVTGTNGAGSIALLAASNVLLGQQFTEFRLSAAVPGTGPLRLEALINSSPVAPTVKVFVTGLSEQTTVLGTSIPKPMQATAGGANLGGTQYALITPNADGGDPRYVATVGGTMTGPLVLSADPSVVLGAATKQYVDAQHALSVPVAGGTMTGALTLFGAPTAALHAATKAYADTMVPLAGGTMTGLLTLSAAPTANMHAVTKLYVDTQAASLREFLGAWKVATNSPSITAGGSLAGAYYIATTVNPDVPEVVPAGVPGIAGVTIENSSTVLWDDVLKVWQVIQGGSLSKTTADATYLALAGGTLTGNLVLHADPTVALGAATKGYVDTHGHAFPWTTGAAYPVGTLVMYDGVTFQVATAIAAAPAVPDFTTILVFGYGQADYYYANNTTGSWVADQWVTLATMPAMGTYRVDINATTATVGSDHVLEITSSNNGAALTVVASSAQAAGALFSNFRLSANGGGTNPLRLEGQLGPNPQPPTIKVFAHGNSVFTNTPSLAIPKPLTSTAANLGGTQYVLTGALGFMAPATTLWGNPTALSAFMEPITLGTNLQFTGSALTMSPMAAHTLKGNPTTGNAVPSDVTLGGGLSFVGTALGLASVGPTALLFNPTAAAAIPTTYTVLPKQWDWTTTPGTLAMSGNFAATAAPLSPATYGGYVQADTLAAVNPVALLIGGQRALYQDTRQNFAAGWGAGLAINAATTGATYVGFNSGNKATAPNSFYGFHVGEYTIAGYNNVAYGMWTFRGSANPNTAFNAAFGTYTMAYFDNGALNSAYGPYAMQYGSGNSNVASGPYALRGNPGALVLSGAASSSGETITMVFTGAFTGSPVTITHPTGGVTDVPTVASALSSAINANASLQALCAVSGAACRIVDFQNLNFGWVGIGVTFTFATTGTLKGQVLAGSNSAQNIASGAYAMEGNYLTTAHDNVAQGAYVLQNIIDGSYNFGAIYGALGKLSSGTDWIGIGQGAAGNVTTSAGGIALGPFALNSAQTGLGIAIGSYALGNYASSNTDPLRINVAMGHNALRGASANNFFGNGNVGIGPSAGAGIDGVSNFNTIVGAGGALILGNAANNNTILGANVASVKYTGQSGSIFIGVDSSCDYLGYDDVLVIKGRENGNNGVAAIQVLGMNYPHQYMKTLINGATQVGGYETGTIPPSTSTLTNGHMMIIKDNRQGPGAGVMLFYRDLSGALAAVALAPYP
jgi:hypothetical protein